ncbi:MAG: DUF4115 domain-containing protein [Alphaproteobacteria bacterium HGW-Alphaproteobacteria-2]|nr:MAG: DUF4115 domain-containing protein [Alphaproteobacteria bacterium HGW-Alphaproteobacteria-2]
MIGRKSGPNQDDQPSGVAPRGFDDYDLRLGDIMRGERATKGKSLLDAQRDLRIRASYLAAIESADLSAFESRGFVAGFVRSYARYLGLDPEWAWRTFCAESGFEGANAFDQRPADTARAAPARRAVAREAFAIGLPDVRPGILDRVQPGALGSLAVLLALLAGLGYGGLSLLHEVQRVHLVPVDEPPGIVTTLPGLDMQAADAGADVALPAAPEPEALARVYRPQALDFPVVVARDGPIAALDPGALGVFAPATQRQPFLDRLAAAESDPVAEVIARDVQVIESVRPRVELVALRPAWVRVFTDEGTVLFEKILDAGERYAVPERDVAPRLRAGNSGSLFLLVDGQAYGPVGPGTSVARRVSLAPDDITGGYRQAELPADLLARQPSAVAESAAAPTE